MLLSKYQTPAHNLFLYRFDRGGTLHYYLHQLLVNRLSGLPAFSKFYKMHELISPKALEDCLDS